ncbi:MAG: glycosyltransferase family 4 protein [Gemmatimonadota bacterium]|nr:glycosyltransferase family 4 protein [Gemmatimonadota bacterium]
MSGLRFAFITTFYPPHNFGGDGIGVQRWARALARRGHHVTVICDTDVYKVLKTGPAPPAVAEDSGITVHWLRSGVAPLSVLLSHQAGRPVFHAAAIKWILHEGRFDVINFHNVSALGGPGVLGMGSALKLYTAWEHWLVCPTHVLWRHNREACTGRECLRCVLAYGRPPQLWRYTGKLEREAQHIDAFIALSEFSRAKHREFGFQREMEVIPGFLPDPDVEVGGPDAQTVLPSEDDNSTSVGLRSSGVVQAIAPREGGSSIHPRPYFFFAGRLERIKGLDDVIPVFEHYTDADLIIAGDGAHRAELESIAGRNPRVKFLGMVTGDVVDRYNAHAIASIVPSAGFETFGFVIIEAFRRGTPVIARRIGPFPELLESCGGGELFETAGELIAALSRMQQEPSRRAELARAAYKGFLANWTESAVLPKYFSLLERIAVSRGRTDIARMLQEGRAA